MFIAPIVLLAALLTEPIAIPVQSTMPSACFVYGEVSRTDGVIEASLSSNCPIAVEQRDQSIVMRGTRGQHRTVSAPVPDERGTYQFVYRWGNTAALFDDERVNVKLGAVATVRDADR